MTLIIKSPNLYSLILLTRIFFLPPLPNLSFDNSFIPFTVQNFKIRSTRRSHRAWKISQGRFAGERCVERPFYFSSAGWGDERALVSGGKERSSTLLLRGLDAPETRLSRYYKSSSRLDRATSRKAGASFSYGERLRRGSRIICEKPSGYHRWKAIFPGS